MRLLHCITLELREFVETEVPGYAILSHRWERDEVSFQDMQSGDAKKKAGYSKIIGSAKQALADGCEYIWVDTCCIDKSSSAELSEAINSMYQWYQYANVCLVYLSDVEEWSEEAFKESQWHKRGWTLQEPIAPTTVVFYANDWCPLGTKESLHLFITAATRIEREVLLGQEELGAISIARRMSWAAGRETTRVEDLAYCLMGIFNVNMPLLYGESNKDFIRLQEEIMKGSDDHTLFAWTNDNGMEDSKAPCGLLASAPSAFKDSGHFKPYRDWNASLPFSLTNKGLFIQLILSPFGTGSEIMLAVLDCQSGDDLTHRPAIYLKCLSERANQFARIKSSTITLLDPNQVSRGILANVYVRQQILLPTNDSRDISSFCIQSIESGLTIDTVAPEGQWDPRTRTIPVTRERNRAQISFAYSSKSKFIVLLGVTPFPAGSEGWCRICEPSQLSKLLEDVQARLQPNSDSMYITKEKIARVRLLQEIVLGKKILLVQVSLEKGNKFKASWDSRVRLGGMVEAIRNQEYTNVTFRFIM